MESQKLKMLPPMAPFPQTAWRDHMLPDEWVACLDAWIMLAETHLSLTTSDFARLTAKDESVARFLASFIEEIAKSPDLSSNGDALRFKKLRRVSFFLSSRLLDVEQPPETLVSWGFLADFSKVYGRKLSSQCVAGVWAKQSKLLEASLTKCKSSLIEQLGAGLQGKPAALEQELKRLNHLLHVSPETDTLFMTGSDFLDGLVSCYNLMNPPLRKAIISTSYLCLIGLLAGSKSNSSLLTDQLYALKAAAEAHKAGPTNVDNSMVAELVTVTPILQQMQQKGAAGLALPNRAKSAIASLEGFRKAGGGRPKRLIKRKVNKGKNRASDDEYGHGAIGQIHVHQMSLITQIQDLFPDLGSGFVMKLLDEYNEDVEQVVSHLLEDSLPAHLGEADRHETLSPTHQVPNEHAQDMAPRSTPPMLPVRHNVFDDDEFDQLAIDASRLHLGRRNLSKTADDILQDRSAAPAKAAILSALAAFDSDDDERDDTYDVQDVGGTVDSATPGNNTEERPADTRNAHDEVLFRALKMTPNVYDRDAATRRGKPRLALREETGLTDEAIEGWALMLSRDPRRMRRLEASYSSFSGAQRELAPSSWRAESGTEESDIDGGAADGRGSRAGFRGRGVGGAARDGARNRGRGGGGRGRGNVAGPTGEKDTEVARQRKEANKGSRANHNRRDQRAKKMARGGFPG
ncbi:MAG: hypothetical protein M1818_003088 [Claussenomyces sp. TS43310]|nr:MAG: hypothetical protein M1818_003088 [Claussenomyces sp. TS43310]